MYKFKVWDQANDGNTMAIRVANTAELSKLTAHCLGHCMLNAWSSLKHYLVVAAKAKVRPDHFVRQVDVLWLKKGLGLPPWTMCHNRLLRVLNTGNARKSGGFASQAYVILDPSWNAVLRPHHKQAIRARYLPGPWNDLIVVLDK